LTDLEFIDALLDDGEVLLGDLLDVSLVLALHFSIRLDNVVEPIRRIALETTPRQHLSAVVLEARAQLHVLIFDFLHAR
jgi:hypothetical protein